MLYLIENTELSWKAMENILMSGIILMDEKSSDLTDNSSLLHLWSSLWNRPGFYCDNKCLGRTLEFIKQVQDKR